VTTYYSGKTESLRDLFGDAAVSVEPGRITVDGHAYPVVDDVIILLEESRLPPGIRRRWPRRPERIRRRPVVCRRHPVHLWRGVARFPEILPEHRKEFLQY
jgi:hypothetical protein